MNVISIVNMKGGVTKTTTATSVAKGLVDKGYKVLLIDADPQANATDIVGKIGNELTEKFIKEFTDENIKNQQDFFKKLNECLYEDYEINSNLKDVFKDPDDINRIIRHSDIENLDYIPAALSLTETKIKTVLCLDIDNKHILNEAFSHIEDKYDYCIIDNAPDDSIILTNVINVSNLVIVPIKCDKGSLKGLIVTINKLSRLQKEAIRLKMDMNFDLKILMTMMNKNKIDSSILQLFEKYCGDMLLNTKIRYRAKPASESSINNQYLIDSKLNIGWELKKLTNEIEEYFNDWNRNTNPFH